MGIWDHEPRVTNIKGANFSCLIKTSLDKDPDGQTKFGWPQQTLPMASKCLLRKWPKDESCKAQKNYQYHFLMTQNPKPKTLNRT